MVDREPQEWIERVRSKARHGVRAITWCVLAAFTFGCTVAQYAGEVTIENASGVAQSVELRTKEQRGDDRAVVRVDLPNGGTVSKRVASSRNPPEVRLVVCHSDSGRTTHDLTNRIPLGNPWQRELPGPMKAHRVLRCVLRSDLGIEFLDEVRAEDAP